MVKVKKVNAKNIYHSLNLAIKISKIMVFKINSDFSWINELKICNLEKMLIKYNSIKGWLFFIYCIVLLKINI